MSQEDRDYGLESTTNEQWDKLAQMVRQEIAAGDITPLYQVFPPKT